MTMADPGYSFGGEYPVDPHHTPYAVVHRPRIYDNGPGPVSPGSLRPNITMPLGAIDPDNEPTDTPDVPGPYAPVAEEEL